MRKAEQTLTEKQKAMLDALAKVPEDDIDFSDIPDTKGLPKMTYRGAGYQPVKQTVSLKLDEYVINWFYENLPRDGDLQEQINEALLQHIIRNGTKARRSLGKEREAERGKANQ